MVGYQYVLKLRQAWFLKVSLIWLPGLLINGSLVRVQSEEPFLSFFRSHKLSNLLISIDLEVTPGEAKKRQREAHKLLKSHVNPSLKNTFGAITKEWFKKNLVHRERVIVKKCEDELSFINKWNVA